MAAYNSNDLFCGVCRIDNRTIVIRAAWREHEDRDSVRNIFVARGPCVACCRRESGRVVPGAAPLEQDDRSLAFRSVIVFFGPLIMMGFADTEQQTEMFGIVLRKRFVVCPSRGCHGEPPVQGFSALRAAPALP